MITLLEGTPGSGKSYYAVADYLLPWLRTGRRLYVAVDARARINIPFGASLTAAARLPDNADRSLIDPFAEKKIPWKRYLFLLLVLAALLYAWRTGAVGRWLGI